jgi:hypothetical protein
VADAVEEAQAVEDAVCETAADAAGVGVDSCEGDAVSVFDTVVLGVHVAPAEKEGRDAVAVKEEAAEGVEPPLALPCTPPPPCEGDSDIDADSVLVAAPEMEGAAMVIEGVELTVSEGDLVRLTDAEGVMVRETCGEADTEGEAAAEAVSNSLTVSVGVGDTEAEAREEPVTEGEPEPVFVAEEEEEAEPEEDAEAAAEAVPSGDPEPVPDAERVAPPVTEDEAVVVRE